MFLDKYCGHSFWDPNISWNTTSPVLSPCFNETVLLWPGSLFLITFGLASWLFNSNKASNSFPGSFMFYLKLSLHFLLSFTSIIEFFEPHYNFNGNESLELYQMISPFIRLLVFSFAAILLIYNKRKGITTSGVIFIFWFLMMIQSLASYWTLIDAQYLEKGRYRPWQFSKIYFAIKTVQLPCMVILWFLNCFADQSKVSKHVTCPIVSASFFSRLVFFWYDSLAYLGYKKALTENDLASLPQKHRAQSIEEKLKKTETISTETEPEFRSNNLPNEAQYLKPVEHRISLSFCLIKCFGLQFVSCTLMKITCDLLLFVNPLIIGALLNFLASDEPNWHGILITLILFIMSVIRSTINSQYEFWIRIFAMKIKSALIAKAYRKSIQLSNKGRRNYNTGDIINLISVDVQLIFESLTYSNLLISTPIQILVAFYFLWIQIGLASLTGILMMIFAIPLNTFIFGKFADIESKVLIEKDRRVNIISELLNGMKVLKLYAWEGAFSDMINKIRHNEIKLLKKYALQGAYYQTLAISLPTLIFLGCIATFILISESNNLNASRVFVTLSIINSLRVSLQVTPLAISKLAGALVSFRRIENFLKEDELSPSLISNENNREFSIIVKDATFCWTHGDNPVLKNINMKVMPGKSVAIVGPVGSGKSSLVSAFLGELHKKEGSISVNGKIAYVPQTAWIKNDTIRNNILFGHPFQEDLYSLVIQVCALSPDLRILPGGDLTEIGERGINLSGGQKQRISLARAVYSNADIFLLDDPLSAVDAHVARHLFDKVIGQNGILQNKTRLLVTHRLTFLQQIDEIIVLKNGCINEYGTYDELMKNEGDFADLLTEYLHEAEQEIKTETETGIDRGSEEISPEMEKVANYFDKTEQVENEMKNMESGELIANESVETGSIKLNVYFKYLKISGWLSTFLYISLFIVSNTINFGSNLWLSAWADEDMGIAINNNQAQSRYFRLAIYAFLELTACCCNFIAAIVFYFAFLKGCRWLHDQMLSRVIRAPMTFFDTTPVGRILNRFTTDIDIADRRLNSFLYITLSYAFFFIFSIIGVCIESEYLIIAIFVLCIFYVLLQKYCMASSRQLQRIESITRSPIYSHFSETISGLSCIRSYNANDRFISECYNRIDKTNIAFFLNTAAGQWLNIRLKFIGDCVVLLSSVLTVYLKGKLSPGLIGLILNYAIQMTTYLHVLLEFYSQIENLMVSIERCLEFTKVENEAPWTIEHCKPKQGWPSNGEIVFKNFSTRYRAGLDLALNQISCKFEKNSKIGIVGRTGAGKSSLALALFRLIEPAEGTIYIDNQDITQIGLHDLRSQLTVIPQDPVLFSASLRSNLDPFNKYSDDEIWKALEQAHLKEYVLTLNHGLESEIAEGGENLSVGQRQLVCLTRALLRKSKILVLDEATAAVDVETDELIQDTIRREFSDCTIVTIAHRLNTVMDYDKIMVMDNGKMAEYDSPARLLADESSVFYSLAKQAKVI